MLNHSEDQKQSTLESEAYYKDSNELDSTEGTAATNPGLYQRKKLTAGSRKFQMVGPLRCFDLCNQPKLILNGVGIIVRLFPSTEAFRLMTSDAVNTYKISIEDVQLHI